MSATWRVLVHTGKAHLMVHYRGETWHTRCGRSYGSTFPDDVSAPRCQTCIRSKREGDG